MADLALQRRPNGKYDFVLRGNDLITTTDPDPAILRLLIQDTWIGDDGERAGDSLGAVKLSTTRTRDQVQRIVEQRLGVLLRSGQLTAVSVLEVRTVEGRLYAFISVTKPGQQPSTIQVPLVD
jgi:hypothetical protein